MTDFSAQIPFSPPMLHNVASNIIKTIVNPKRQDNHGFFFQKKKTPRKMLQNRRRILREGSAQLEHIYFGASHVDFFLKNIFYSHATFINDDNIYFFKKFSIRIIFTKAIKLSQDAIRIITRTVNNKTTQNICFHSCSDCFGKNISKINILFWRKQKSKINRQHHWQVTFHREPSLPRSVYFWQKICKNILTFCRLIVYSAQLSTRLGRKINIAQCLLVRKTVYGNLAERLCWNF